MELFCWYYSGVTKENLRQDGRFSVRKEKLSSTNQFYRYARRLGRHIYL
jgi:hypothetical protein